jgi:hypothetical protein
MRASLLHFQKELHQKQITPERFTLPPDYTIDILSSSEKVDNWIQENIKSDSVVGMDTEWDCTEDERGYPHVIAIATDRTCLLYQVPSKRHRLSTKFLNLLIDSKVKKVWCENSLSLEKIRRWVERRLEGDAIVDEISLELRTPKSHVDISNLVNETDVKGLRRISLRYLGKTIDEDVDIMSSRWSASDLSDAQKRYAAEDAYVPLLVYNKINS